MSQEEELEATLVERTELQQIAQKNSDRVLDLLSELEEKKSELEDISIDLKDKKEEVRSSVLQFNWQLLVGCLAWYWRKTQDTWNKVFLPWS